MSRNLVVAHQTADSPELMSELARIRQREPEATFVLVVPATPVHHLRGWTEGEAKALAIEAGKRASSQMERSGIVLMAIRVGDPDPVNAAADEWNDRPEYDRVILSTLPAGMSRWLKADAGRQIERRLRVPVIQVVAEPR